MESKSSILRPVDISKDSMIKVLIKSALLPREQVQNYIRQNLLDSHFDYYDTQVSAFDIRGKSLDNIADAQSFQVFEERYKIQKYQTSYANIFFVNDAANAYQKQYIDFIPLIGKDNKYGNHPLYTIWEVHKPKILLHSVVIIY